MFLLLGMVCLEFVVADFKQSVSSDCVTSLCGGGLAYNILLSHKSWPLLSHKWTRIFLLHW